MMNADLGEYKNNENSFNKEKTAVVRRQKKSKTETLNQKKRVSFHEDILNSTKIDDIHINRGLITYLPDGANKRLLDKQGIVIGRCYSWSINDDNEKSLMKIERETKSELFSCKSREDSGINSECTATNSSSTSSLYTFPNFSNLKKTGNLAQWPYSEPNLLERSLISSTNQLFGSLKTIWSSNKSGAIDGHNEYTYDVQQAITLEKTEPEPKVIPNNTVEYQGVTYSNQYAKFLQEFQKEKEVGNGQPNSLLSFYQKVRKSLNIFSSKTSSVQPNQDIDTLSENSITSCQDLTIDSIDNVETFDILKVKRSRRKSQCKSNRNSLLVFDNNQRRVLSDVNKKINSEINHELYDNSEQSKNRNISTEIQELLKFQDEKIVKIYKIWTSNSTPELLILTDSAINFVIITCDPLMTISSFNFVFNDLYSILIGPNNYWLLISNETGDLKRFFFMLSKQMTENFMQQLEIQLRRKKFQLPVFRQLNFMENNDMKQLWSFIRHYRDLSQEESNPNYFFYYGIVRIHCFNHQFETYCMSGSGMDLSFISFPIKEGALMFQIGKSKPSWDTGYFILKGGILYIFSSTSSNLPLRSLLLASGRCEMIRRVEHPQRPHTFELIYDGLSYLMAAPDEFVTSEWLQVLIESVSSGYSNSSTFQQNSILSNTEICTILLTGTFIILLRENVYQYKNEKQPYEIIACANLADLISLQLPSKKDESWCILEFECQEVLENSGDWILYFGADDDMMEFFNLLEILWNAQENTRFPVETVDESKKMYEKCLKTFRYLKHDLWPKSLISFY